MPARTNTAEVVELPVFADATFLNRTVEGLEALRSESEARGYGMLASLLAIAQTEAVDDLRTKVQILRVQQGRREQDDGAARLASKLAHRGTKPQA